MNKILKKFSYLMAIGLIAALIPGCAKKPDKNQVVAEINNYSVTIDDFKQEAEMTIPGASKDLILQDIIAKELLLQEAQKMNLDKNKQFMKEIENYWKQALIKRLINIKGDEFLAMSKVSSDEIRVKYDLMAQENEGKIKPYEQLAGQISKNLVMRKAQILLDNWINNLRKDAIIIKHDKVFNTIKLKKADN